MDIKYTRIKVMNEDKLKAMWNKTESLESGSLYNSQLIQKYLSGRSNDISRKMRNMIRFDMVVKALIACVFGVDMYFFYGSANIVLVSFLAILILIPMIIYERKMMVRFDKAAGQGQNLRENLSSMLSYLKTKFTSTLLAISITYLFVFISGSLIYFYFAYGYVRPLDYLDVVVFTGFIMIGIVFNFIVNRGQVKYQIRHLENCLSDLNDQALPLAEEMIESQRKQDRANKLILGVLLIFGFLLLIVVLLNVGI
jgi:ABC-type multidrug transport system fused ATPase/permease subunit